MYRGAFAYLKSFSARFLCVFQASFLQVEGRRDDVTAGLLDAWQTLNPEAKSGRDYRTFHAFDRELAFTFDQFLTDIAP